MADRLSGPASCPEIVDTAMEKGDGFVRVRSGASGRLIMVRVIAPGAVEPVLDAAPAGDGPANDVICSRTH